LAAKHGYRHLSFAGPMKRGVLHLLGINEADLEEPNKSQELTGWGFTPRYFMQQLGTEFLRNVIHPDFHLKRMDMEIANIDKMVRSKGDYVISDVRFDNEAQYIHDRGGAVIIIERDGLVRMNHASEAGITITEHDFVISNSGTKDDLYAKLDQVMGVIGR
jgi:hypothetical protein